MTKQVQRRRGTASQHTSFTGAEGELSVNTTNKSVHVHDGTTAGGIEAARADLSNVSDANLNAALSGNTVASLTITSADINGGTIDGTTIGGTTPAAGTFSSATVNGNITVTGTVDGRDVATDGSKLDGIEAGADVTDTANVTAAGALMDSELTDIAAVKALDQGVATTDDPTFTNTQLAAIAESKAVTAVDVFVYDTSKDSDGGAWRKRTQGTSWYNETLNTATRGSRREFPAVAVIVAEAANVTIYDGDDPSLPMWMVFTPGGSGSNFNFLITGSTRNGCTALNGKLCVSNGSNAFTEISFIDERVQQRYSAGMFFWSVGIVDRNSTPLRLGGSNAAKAIVNTTVNDVAMTVLPDAPIDPATGLQVPTIAVATAGGVSVIKDDGTVVDSADVTTTATITFDSAGFWWSSASSYKLWHSTYAATAADGFGTQVSDVRKQFATIPLGVKFSKLVLGNDDILNIAGNSNLENTVAGLSIFKPDYGTQANGMSSVLTSTYNTGWMNGDIKGAFLSDTDDTDLVASGELVTNGTFDTDTSGWSAAGTNTGGDTGFSWDASGTMRVFRGGGGIDGRPYQAITTEIGERYVLTLDASRISGGNGVVAVRTTLGGNIIAIDTALNSSVSISFVANATTLYIEFWAANGTEIEVDNISIKLADADRSVNNNGLIVNGTVTRTAVATGADLVAYSGFSADNYLAQPYNSALDLGTGDFSFMWWTKGTDTNAHFFDRDDVPSAGVQIRSYCSATTWTFNAVVALTITANVQDGSWKHLCVRRESGVLYMYINGALVGSVAHTSNLTNTAANLYVGNTSAGGSPLNDGSLALLRISATAPSAEQIAKIYEDEKFLFQENAQATLYGASDAVTALAHDDATDLLHVGTSAGRSVFQGLRRVSNTTTAVGTAISASNGLVVEE